MMGSEMPLSPQQLLRIGKSTFPHHDFITAFVVPQCRLKKEAIWAATQSLLDSHDALSLGLRNDSSRWTMFDIPRNEIVEPFQHVPSADSDEMGETIRRSLAAVDLVRHGPMLVILFDMRSDGSQRLFFAVHHLFCDGASFQLIWQEFAEAYLAALADAPTGAAAVDRSAFRRWATWVDRQVKSIERYRLDRDAIARRLGCADLALPYERHQPRQRTNGDFLVETMEYQNKRTVSGLRKLFRRQVRTSFEFGLLTILCRSLCSTLGSGKVLLLLQHHGRDVDAYDRSLYTTVGKFSHEVPIAAAVTDELNFVAHHEVLSVEREEAERQAFSYLLLSSAAKSGNADVDHSMPAAELAYTYQGDYDETEEVLRFTAAPEALNLPSARHVPRSYALAVLPSVVDGKITVQWKYDYLHLPRELPIRLNELFFHEIDRSVRELT